MQLEVFEHFCYLLVYGIMFVLLVLTNKINIFKNFARNHSQHAYNKKSILYFKRRYMMYHKNIVKRK